MRSTFETVVSVLLTVAALLIAAAIVRREFFVQSPTSKLGQHRPTYVEGWKELLGGGILSGPLDAPIKVVEFTDLECPFCKQFHETVRVTQAKYGAQVAHVFVHYPLPAHRFARPAARAAECANDQGDFMAFVDLVFLKQDSLGLKSWTSYASEAGVRDTARFAQCAADMATVPRIEEGRALGKKIGVMGTPTVIVNGWRLPGTPNDSQLSRVITDILAGREPAVAATSPDRRQ